MAKKPETVFFCKECGNEFPRWEGRCRSCGCWDGLVEAPRKAEPAQGRAGAPARATALSPGQGPRGKRGARPLHAYAHENLPRIALPQGEFHRVLGGGAVPGGSVLVGGEPGIGKSTLMLQMLGSVAATFLRGEPRQEARRLLYVSGEEAPSQIAARGHRLGEWWNANAARPRHSEPPGPGYRFDSEDLLLASETDLEEILAMFEEHRPRIAVVDSVQTLRDGQLNSAAGAVSQVRETTKALVDAAQRLETALFLIGHVTKEGTLAGPRVMEHIVDTVLSFEGEPRMDLRILRATKNRFGSTNEVGLFEMTGGGLAEVPDPSAVLLDRESEHEKGPGSTVGAASEGTRILLVEIQALTVPVPGGGTPRRRASGLDLNRLSMVLAVLETKANVPFGHLDVFSSAAGGFRIDEPAADLPLALALASVATQRPVRKGLVAAGEVGLGGEIRSVPRLDARVAEARRLGFTHFLLPARGKLALPPESEFKVLRARDLREALAMGLG